YFYPKMSAQLGATKSPELIWNYSLLVTKKIFFILFTISFFGVLVLPLFLDTFFPKYIDGLLPAQLALISGLFSGIGVSFYSALNTMKAFGILGKLILFKIVLFYSLIFLFGGLLDVLLGVSVGLLICEVSFL